MKTKRRHELHTNILADWLEKNLEPVLPYWKAILAVVIAVTAVCLVLAIFPDLFTRSVPSEQWQSYFKADYQTDNFSRDEQLATLAKDPYQHLAGVVAMLRKADTLKANASIQLSQNRSQAVEDLREAEEYYLELLDSPHAKTSYQRRAQYGLGLTYEMLGDLEKAQKQFLLVSQQEKDSLLGREARRHWEKLVDPETKKLRPNVVAFYKAFSSYDPGDFEPLPSRPSLRYPGSSAAAEGPGLSKEFLGQFKQTPPDEKEKKPEPTDKKPGDDPAPKPPAKKPDEKPEPTDKKPDAENKKPAGDDPAPKPPAKKPGEKPTPPKSDSSKPGDK